VKFIFAKKGQISLRPGPGEDAVMERAIEAGAEDVVNHGAEGFEIDTEPAELHHVAAELEKSGLQLADQKWTWVPSTIVHVDGDHARKLLKLIEALEDNDDVQNVYANFEMDESLMHQHAS
jgi:transcriptional/translational regulatory protein YebC/TACO1